jgi:ribosomal-protein-alanine N-acetyltransferase
MKIYLESDRLILRSLEDSDLEGMYALESDPEVHKYLGNQPLQNRDECMDIIRYIQQQYKDYGIGRWAVIDKASGEFAGWSGLKCETIVRDYDYWDVGYRLRREFWGKGIATETATMALKYGFETLGFEKICGGAHVENIASNIVLKRIGLNLVESILYNGDPHYWYELSKEEWNKHQ